MRYAEYRSLGLPIGSGAHQGGLQDGREAAHEMHRHALDGGANPVLWVRCARLGSWLDDYWEQRYRQTA